MRRTTSGKQPWHLALSAVLGCAPARVQEPPATPNGSDATGAEPVRIITERTDQLRLPPGEQLSPDPGTEAALRRHIESVQHGGSGLEEMVPELADTARAQPAAHNSVVELGDLREIALEGKGPGGADLFEVTTTKGVSHWGIVLNPEGKIATLFFHEDPPATVPSEPELLRQLEARLDRAAAADEFSGVVLVAKNGKPIFEAARGLADRERKQKVGMQTKFRIASMNKMFTAVAVLKLREQGKLSLDDTLAKWLPDYPNKELAQAVTLHHLLTHTGGTGDIPLYDGHRPDLTSHQAYVDAYGKRGLAFPPGARFEYSNYGFMLLGRVIEKASGESYYDYVQKYVYAPAQMTATGSELESKIVPDRSVGYKRGREGLKPNVDSLPPRGVAAAGGYSTAEDLLRFANALQSHALLSEASTQLLLTGKIQMGPNAQYAYGFVERNQSGIHSFGHNGGAPGMSGQLAILPEAGYVVVALANLDPPAAVDMSNFVVERLPRVASEPARASTPPAALESASVPREPPRGPNLVDNGDFSQGDRLWVTLLWPATGPWQPIPARVEKGALCTSLEGGQNMIVAWPALADATKAIELRQGQPYRLSFRASTTGPLAVRMVAKVGHQAPPFTSAVQAPVPVEAAARLFAIDFEPDHADAQAGIAFILSAPRGDAQNEVCLDDVSLVGGGDGSGRPRH